MKADRIRILMIGAAFLWVLMIGRTFQIQVVEGNVYGDRAESQSQRRMIWKPDRGNIVDRDGNILATNQPFWNKMDLDTRRLYPESELACQVLGYTGRDGQGLQGIEYAFDEKLRGIDGWSYQTVDAQRHAMPGMERKGRAPTPGLEMVLTIQRDYQEIMENALAKGITDLEADRGSAVLLDPYTGEILAMASWPGFDPNKPISLSGKAIRNDLISLSYEPGSTFKAITASAALEEHTIDPEQLIDTEHGHMVLASGDIINDTEDHGVLNMTDALALSSNVAFAKIGTTVGNQKFYRYARAFGIGSQTMIEMPGEETGKLKPIHEWSARTLMTMSFGHEVMATPLQMTMAYAVIANGGELVQPHIVKEWRNPETGEVVQSTQRKVIRRVISQETAAKVRVMLREVVQRGTGKTIKSDLIDIAGKTGTAEKFNTVTGKYDHNAMISSFVGMVPAHNPRFLCMVVVDDARKERYGGSTAAPIFKEIMERVYYHPVVSPMQYKLAQVQSGNLCQSTQFIGLSKGAAEQLAKEKGCTLAFRGEGTQVVVQLLGNTSGQNVDLLLTMGQMSSKQMPDLRGLSLRDAMDALGSARSAVQVVGKGWVVEQDPLPNAPIIHGQSLNLVLKEKT